MAMKTDMLGYQYDDSVPSFVAFSIGNPKEASGQKMFVYHRPTRRILDQETLNAQAAAEGYTFPEGEVGEDDAWLWQHAGLASAPKPDVPSDNAYAGYPGGFNGNTPADMAEVAGIIPVPATAWNAPQYAVLADGTEVSWNGTEWVEGKATPVIVSPADGSTVYSAYYPIMGSGARPGSPVELRSLLNPLPDGLPQDVVKARPDGTFVFAGTQAAADNEQWTVTSAGQTSAPITVVTAEPQEIAFTATVTDLTVTVTVTSAVQGDSMVDFGDDSTPTEVAANTPLPYTYAVAETYTITVTPPEGAAGLPWLPASKDVTATEPVEEPQTPTDPEPEPEPPAGEDTVSGGAA